MTESIANAIRQFIIARYLPDEDPARLTDTTPLVSGGILDSLSILELVSFLEERFQVVLAAHELDRVHFDSLQSIEALVQSKLS